MDAKLRAKELYDIFFPMMGHIDPFCKAKQCAIIAVDEIIEELDNRKDVIDENNIYYWENKVIELWKQLKPEIENL